MHVHVEPQVDKPPGSSMIGDRLIGPKPDRYLMEQVIDRSEEVFTEGDQISCC